MKLRYILEIDLKKAIARMGPLLQTMPKARIRHSERVAKVLNKAKVGKVGVYTGLLHDYLERGGDLYTLSQHIDELKLPPQIVQAVHALSDDEKNVETKPNQPLMHLQDILHGITDDDLRNIVILAKLSDRLDNLKKRGKRGKIGVKYRAKSLDLINWLSHNYTGKSKPLHKMLKAIDKFLTAAQTELT